MGEDAFLNPVRAEKLLGEISKLVCNNDLVSMIKSVSLASPDADGALLYFLRLFESLIEKGLYEGTYHNLLENRLQGILALVFSASEYLSELIINDPLLILSLMASPYFAVPKPREVMIGELGELCSSVASRSEFMKTIRKYRHSEILRIASRDLMGAPIDELMSELSDLAEASLDSALRYSVKELLKNNGMKTSFLKILQEELKGFVILGMGKLGGRELNYSSDIDLIYLFEGGEDSEAKEVYADFWKKVSESVTELIGKVTEDGLVFRVDLRLRPHGSSGAVASSLESAVDYYLTWGETWERSALLKARAVAGDKSLGDEFLKTIEPWLNRKYLDFGLIEEIREMKLKIDADARRLLRGSWDVKLGGGGIREVEFFVQSMQLIHGGKMPRILRRNTLEAIDALCEVSLISEFDRYELAEAYRFLRKLEHRIQFEEFAQTQKLPTEPQKKFRLAGAMGFRGSYYERWDAFESVLEEMRARVSERYRALFVAAVEETKQSADEETVLLVTGRLSEEESLEWLKKHGFDEPDNSLNILTRLREGPRRLAYLSDGARSRWRDIAPILIQESANAPDTDMALVNLERFLSGVGARATTLALLRQHLPITKFLVNLFGTSEYLSDFFISKPELLDGLVGPKKEPSDFNVESLRSEVLHTVKEIEDLEEKLNFLRLFVNEKILQIGLDDLGGVANHIETSERLTRVAEATLWGAYEIAKSEVERKYGEAVFRDSDGNEIIGSFAVMGMGKLGAADLSYGSDLDVIFIYSPSGMENAHGCSSHEYFVRLAQRIISALTIETSHGRCYSLDARLRPSGRAGSLVSSLEGFEKYHRESGEAWERQALLKMRFISGDEELGKKVVTALGHFIYEKEFTVDDVKMIKEIRRRMLEERSVKGEGKIDLKVGEGGIVDAEFVVEVLQLKHAREIRRLRTPSTLKAIEALKGVIDENDRVNLLNASNFLRRLSLRIRIIRGVGTPVLDTKRSKMIKFLAKALGYDVYGSEADERLLRELSEKREIIKSLYEKYVN